MTNAPTKFYLAIFLVAPIPRAPLPSERTYISLDSNGETSASKQLSCWQDAYDARRSAAEGNVGKRDGKEGFEIESPEVFMSLVVPAYNEEKRLGRMLKEAVEFLQREYGDAAPTSQANGHVAKRKDATQALSNGHSSPPSKNEGSRRGRGWEILIVSDGSTDQTVATALSSARALTEKSRAGVRVVQLKRNRGKGGAVTHGMRHVRGEYALFADADGASRFEDLGALVENCRASEDGRGRGVAVGSRAWLVGSEAVVKVCFRPPYY